MIQRLANSWRDTSFSAINAGLIAVFISYAGPMALILQAAHAGNLDPTVTVSWVWAASVCTGIVTLVMSLTMRLPMIAAWSIPGSVLLIEGLQHYDIHELVGVYIAVGVVSLILSLTGVYTTLVKLIPSGVINGVLAGILLPICFEAVNASQDMAVMAVVMLITFFLTRRLAPLFAIPAAMGAGIVMLFVTGALSTPSAPVGGSFLAQPVWLMPSFNISAMLSIGIPLLLVTLAGQNLPGAEMMRGFGYRFSVRAALVATNIGGILFAPFGLHSANLATVTGMVCAGPEAHPVRRYRYIAGVSAGFFYLVTGAFAPAIVLVMSMISGPALALISGLILLPALSTALTTLLRRPARRTQQAHTAELEAGIVALVITASDLTVAGITAPCWGIAAGVIVYFLLGARKRARTAPSKPAQSQPASSGAKQFSSSGVQPTGRKSA